MQETLKREVEAIKDKEKEININEGVSVDEESKKLADQAMQERKEVEREIKKEKEAEKESWLRKHIFSKFKKNPEEIKAKEIKRIKKTLEEDISDLLKIKTADTGLGGDIGSMSMGGNWNEIIKTYEIPKEQVDAVIEGIKKYKKMENSPERVAFVKTLNNKKLDITTSMRKYATNKINQLQ